MTEKIPKIIHQIWSGIDEPLPEQFKLFGETWKKYHPSWKYEFWDNEKMNTFIRKYYPQYLNMYQSFPYNIQRRDTIRYLILYLTGGMYVDFDSECLEPFDMLLNEKSCCFSMEPEEHGKHFGQSLFFNNALMACIPNHPFMKEIICHIFNHSSMQKQFSHKYMEIFTTTGPLMLVDLYKKYPHKDDIFLIPAKYVSPFNVDEIKKIRHGYESEELENKLKGAYSVHYFFNGWVKNTE